MRKKTDPALKIAFLVLICLTAWGCSGAALPEPFFNPLESRLIQQVPYFSNTLGAGGPAALASVMTYEGHPTTPEEALLVFGDNHPSPQAMAGFARRVGKQKVISFSGVPPQLLEAVRRNQPLIVRLGLAVPPLPAGIYAVVVGYTPDGPVLNAGNMHQQIIPWGKFLSSWYQADNLIIQINTP